MKLKAIKKETVEPKNTIVFIPHKDYHAKTLIPIAEQLVTEHSVIFLDMESLLKKDAWDTKLVQGLFQVMPFEDFAKAPFEHSTLFTFNDWDPNVNKLFKKAQSAGCKTIAMVEGVNDFFDKDTGRQRNAYRTSEFLILAGEHDKQFFEGHDKTVIGGVPRIMPLLTQEVRRDKKPLAVINVNFSYNVLIDKREMWLHSVLEACERLKLPYVITQHPQDLADLSEFNVSKEDMLNTISRGTVFISRFSSAIIESLAVGVPVVYHNPHGECVPKFQEPCGAYSTSYSTESLIEAIQFESSRKDVRECAKQFLQLHANIQDYSVNNIVKFISGAASPSLLREKVTVVVPVFNTEKYLERCLDSVRNQTYQNLEILVVIDGSPDEAIFVAQKVASRDSRVCIIEQENRGLGGARNTGIQNARGEYLFFLDSDDTIPPEAIEILLAKAVAGDYEIVLSVTQKFEDGVFSKAPYHHIKPGKKTFSSLANGGPLGATAKLFKSEHVKKNDLKFPENRYHEDILFTFKAYVTASKVAGVDRVSYNWLLRSNSITSRITVKHVHDIIWTFEQLIELAKQNRYYSTVKENLYCFFYCYLDTVLDRISLLEQPEANDLRGELKKKLVALNMDNKKLAERLSQSGNSYKPLKSYARLFDLDLAKRLGMPTNKMSIASSPPKVTIVVPVFNTEKYLERCLDSVRNQTYQNLEILVVIDGSPDNSIFIAQTIASRDSRIRIVVQKNLGLSVARNTGMREAQGSYVYFLDSDDTINPQSLELLIERALSTESDIVVSDFSRLEDGVEDLHVYAPYTDVGKEGVKQLCSQSSLMATARLYRLSYLLENNIFFPKGLYHEDLLFTFKAVYYAKRVSSIDYKSYNWIVRDGSVTKTLTSKHVTDTFHVFRKVYNLFVVERPLGVDEYIDFFMYRYARTLLERIVLSSDNNEELLLLFSSQLCRLNLNNKIRALTVKEKFKTDIPFIVLNKLQAKIPSMHKYREHLGKPSYCASDEGVKPMTLPSLIETLKDFCNHSKHILSDSLIGYSGIILATILLLTICGFILPTTALYAWPSALMLLSGITVALWISFTTKRMVDFGDSLLTKIIEQHNLRKHCLQKHVNEKLSAVDSELEKFNVLLNNKVNSFKSELKKTKAQQEMESSNLQKTIEDRIGVLDENIEQVKEEVFNSVSSELEEAKAQQEKESSNLKKNIEDRIGVLDENIEQVKEETVQAVNQLYSLKNEFSSKLDNSKEKLGAIASELARLTTYLNHKIGFDSAEFNDTGNIATPIDLFNRPDAVYDLNSVQVSMQKQILEDIVFHGRGRCLCGNKKLTKICSFDRYEMPFSIVLCESCGLLLTDPYIGNTTIAKYYNDYYHELLVGYSAYEKQNAFFGHNQGEIVFNRVAPHLEEKDLSVLEIGFGAGNILIDFKKLWEAQGSGECHLYGTEFSQKLCVTARKKGINALEGSVAEASKLKTKFDVIILSHVLEHVINIQDFLQSIKSIAHEDTVFYIEVPGVLDLHNKAEYQYDLIKYFIHCHLYHFNLDTLKYYVGNEGFAFLEGSELAFGIFKIGKPNFIDLSCNAERTKKYLIEEEYLRGSPFCGFTDTA